MGSHLDAFTRELAAIALLCLVLTPLHAAGGPSLDELILAAKEDLALRLSLKADEIEFVDALETVWPDSSAGCPRPGVSSL